MNNISWEELDIAQWLPLLIPLIVVQFLLMLIALIVCARSSETNGPKWMWVLIIVFGNLIGPILFFIMGRKNGG